MEILLDKNVMKGFLYLLINDVRHDFKWGRVSKNFIDDDKNKIGKMLDNAFSEIGCSLVYFSWRSQKKS